MRVLTVIAVLLLSLMTSAIALAQDATPPDVAGEAVATEEVLSSVSTFSASGDVIVTVLYRITLPPGASVEAHEHLDATTWHIDEGSVALTVQQGEVFARCAGGCGTGGTPEPTSTEDVYELLPLDTETNLEAGDDLVHLDTVTHAYQNTGDIDAVVTGTATYSLEEGATPTAGDGPGGFTPRGCRGGCL